MGKVFEGFKILSSDFDHIWEKGGTKGRYFSRKDTNQGNTVINFAAV